MNQNDKVLASPELHEKYHQEDRYENSLAEEQIEHVPEGTASPGKALFMLLKAFIGTGVIFLPGSFVSGGLVLSIVLMVLLASICCVAFQILVKAQQSIGGSYGDVAQHLYGAYLRHLIQFFLCISQMGFVCSYMIFISENIGIVVDTVNNCNAPFAAKYYIWIILAVIIPICWVRKIAKLSPIAVIADIFIAFGLICILYFSSAQIHDHGVGQNIILVNQNTFGLMIGTAIFSYEGIGMVLPIVNGMKDPKKFPMVLNLGMLICAVVFTLIGSIGYIAYGDITQASVVANIPRAPLSTTVQVLYAIAMIFSSPFMLYPPLTIIEKYIFGNRSGTKSLKIKWGKNFVRSLVPVVCAAVSFGVGSENLSKFVSLVGSIACMPLCFIFPGLFHYKITSRKTAKILDVGLILFGVLAMVYTVYVNVNSWVHPAESTGVVLSITNCSA
ncbi:transmembrane amino acid transporter protein-domain-containing protein [Gilbertella persicaria]|uniref:transmembrane amino acid transporter protein-domain-containing protein n=1 Tax=Gilbertella persicaria TaxID=101096 RepID=UPI00221EEDA0|nr:transmembrane amino acid transporter protein-domain-containing protein [Gilbertella persicaria]KAI8090213.1 transmembrane amino acid transporter protein-domain-containing protein [Gilbertella persicaria]